MNTGFPESEIFRIGQNKIKRKSRDSRSHLLYRRNCTQKDAAAQGTGNLEAAGGEKKEELDRNYEAMRQKGISVIPWGEKEYPGRLKEIYDPPYALYVKGKLPDNTARAAAIVGARSCTPYGEKYALEYGKNWRNVEFR